MDKHVGQSKKSAKHMRCGASKSQIDDKTPAMSSDSKPTNTKVMGNLYTSLDIELNTVSYVERWQGIVHVRILLPAIEGLFSRHAFVRASFASHY